jgi:hypothetical protein
MPKEALDLKWYPRRTATPWIFVFLLMSGCSSSPMPGLIYTRLKCPLTWDLHDTPVPQTIPRHAKIIEISEPFTGLSINARLKSNAIGEIAREHGLATLYFADQEYFSVLGIWTYQKVILYGE